MKKTSETEEGRDWDKVKTDAWPLLRRKRIEELRSMLGKVKLDVDIPASRRRPSLAE